MAELASWGLFCSWIEQRWEFHKVTTVKVWMEHLSCSNRCMRAITKENISQAQPVQALTGLWRGLIQRITARCCSGMLNRVKTVPHKCRNVLRSVNKTQYKWFKICTFIHMQCGVQYWTVRVWGETGATKQIWWQEHIETNKSIHCWHQLLLVRIEHIYK